LITPELQKEAASEDATLELVRNASEAGPAVLRMQAVSELKRLPMRQRTAHVLCDYVKHAEHPAWRATAAQVLGFHGAVETFFEIAEVLKTCASEERDPIVVKAITFALKDTEITYSLLRHGYPGVATEAVLSVPASEKGLQSLVRLYLKGAAPSVEVCVLRRLGEDPGMVGAVISCLMAEELDDDSRLLPLLRVFPQEVLFDCLICVDEEVTRTYDAIWSGIRRRERKRVLVGVLESRIEEEGVSSQLMDAILSCLLEEDENYEQVNRLMVSILGTLDMIRIRELVERAQLAWQNADQNQRSRLAELFVTLSKTTARVGPEVEEMLASWEAVLPGIQLRAFHARIGKPVSR